MDLIKTSVGLTKTIKNVARLKEIVAVFAKHGFGEFLVASGFDKFIPGFVFSKKHTLTREDVGTYEWWNHIGESIREAFDELGPSFVKLGQLLSTREDILHPALIKQLKLLQDRVSSIPFEIAKRVIEKNLNTKLEDIFEDFNTTPIGNASIGVGYKAILKKNNKPVVIKVRRPGIKRTINTDFEIVLYLVKKLENVSEDLRFLGLSKMLTDFFRSTQNELNFMVEANNCERLKKNISEIDKDNILVIPEIYREFCGEKIIVMEFLDGTPFNQFHSLEELGPDVVEKLMESIRFFTVTLLNHGFFHADLHGGNFFLLKDRRIGIIDFGLMGSISKKNRTNLISILYAVINHDYENLVYEFLDVAEYDELPDHQELIRDIKDSLSPFIGLSVQETNMTDLVRSIIQTLSKHQLYLPREWFIIFRALMTLDGVGKAVNLDLNLFTILEKDLGNYTQELFSKKNAQEELMWIAKDLLTTARVLPLHLKWFIKEASKNKYALEFRLKNLEEVSLNFSRALYVLSMSLIAGVCIISGVIFAGNKSITHLIEVPVASWIFWGFSVYLLLRISFTRRY